jgi:sugar/nucleoside kinase (ribokinase family)
MIPIADSDGKAAFSPLSGGAIFNTSIALGRLDTPVALLSGISTDLFGKQLNKELLNSKMFSLFDKIITEIIIIITPMTGINVTMEILPVIKNK